MGTPRVTAPYPSRTHHMVRLPRFAYSNFQSNIASQLRPLASTLLRRMRGEHNPKDLSGPMAPQARHSARRGLVNIHAVERISIIGFCYDRLSPQTSAQL